jgi:hypothetical protein
LLTGDGRADGTDHLHDALRDGTSLGDPADREQDDELVPAEPGDEV